jgi:hypothetical protein
MSDLQQLLDIEAIKRHKATYGRLVDEIPARGMSAAQDMLKLFTPDCILDFTQAFDRVLHGHADVLDQFGNVLYKKVGWMQHFFTNPIINIDGNRADTYWLLYAHSTPLNSHHDAPKASYGHYLDEYVRTPSGWLQTKLKINMETRVPGKGAAAG